MIPDTMRVARLHGTADLRVETVPVPRPGPDEVLVRIEACGICPTDARKYAIGMDHGDYPLNPGHEWVGRVVASGPDVDGLDPGTRVYGDTYAGYAEFGTGSTRLAVYERRRAEWLTRPGCNSRRRSCPWREYPALVPGAKGMFRCVPSSSTTRRDFTTGAPP